MSAQTTISKDQYLAMDPAALLKNGFRDAGNALRPEMTGLWATAGATQLESISPRELSTVVEALTQVLPLHGKGDVPDRYTAACEEAAEVAYGVLGAPVSPELAQWLHRFAPALRSDRDLTDLMTHLAAVARQHGLFAGLKESNR